MSNIWISDKGYECEFENEVDMIFVDEMDVYLVNDEFGLGSGELIMSESRFMNYYYENEIEKIDVEELIDDNISEYEFGGV